MYKGRIVKIADANTLFANPLHTYTQRLLEAMFISDPHLACKRQKSNGEKGFVLESEVYNYEGTRLIEVDKGYLVRK